MSQKIFILPLFFYIIVSLYIFYRDQPIIYDTINYNEVKYYNFNEIESFYEQNYEFNPIDEKSSFLTIIDSKIRPYFQKYNKKLWEIIPKEVRVNYKAFYASIVKLEEINEENTMFIKRKLLNAEKIVSNNPRISLTLIQEAPSRFKYVSENKIPFVMVREGLINARILQMVFMLLTVLCFIRPLSSFIVIKLETIVDLSKHEE